MPFWKPSTKVASSSSSSSSPSSPQRTITSRNPFTRPSSSSALQPRLTRQRNLRYLDDLDERRYSDVSAASTPGAISRSPSNLDIADAPARSSSSPLPQPLPLPDEAGSGANPSILASPQRDIGYSNGSCRLPSPGGNIFKPDGEEAGAANGVQDRICNPSRSPDSIDLFSTMASNQNHKKPSHLHNISEPSDFRLHMPVNSAPGSGFTSPVHSPRRLSNVDFTQGLNISAAEFHMFGENYVNSPERSPRSSPLRSPGLRPKNLSGPPSPLHSSGNGGMNNVHRLPLPPGAVATASSSSSSSSPSNTCSMAGQWQKGRLIGSGTFGNVFEATNRHTGALCAMKEVNIIPEDAKSIESLKQLELEIGFLSKFQHPNIVQYYGSEITEDRFYIYLEYVHPGSINKYVRQHYGAMTESVVRNFTRHILNGLAYLHSKKIMHRDIKGANLLVDAKGVVKLADFGMAKRLSEAAPNLSLKGTPYWMAPEVLQATFVKDNGGYDLAVDIWSLGCTLIEMITGKPPWSGLEGPAAMFKVLHKTPPIPELLSPEGKDFVQKCFRRNPAERPSAAALLEHPFIRNTSYYNAHGAISPAISATKTSDTTYSPRERKASKSDPYVKGKQSSCESLTHSYPKSPEPSASHSRPHSNPDIIRYNLSPQHPSYGPSTNMNTNSSPMNGGSYNLSSQRSASVSCTNTNMSLMNGGPQYAASSANTTIMNGTNYLTSNANASIASSSIAGSFHPTVLPRPKELHNP
ncbi:Mitogen-activated protein kinase kinase kinase YODA [Rhynchospora pubera]|uniref:mitogen-activated protein kinase kinase kinase n=1 Tax=Rhynchospora pubera TaxID=906938 RepID=A0AAV8CZ00_9POAL|nr:Mitogen-activated protein kinase kinase kinase YODA [Rhynchospora pubera]